jgi:hypothetical protein
MILFFIVTLLIIIKIKIFKTLHRDSIELGHVRPIELGMATSKPNSFGSVLRTPPKTLWVSTHFQGCRGEGLRPNATWCLGDPALGRCKPECHWRWGRPECHLAIGRLNARRRPQCHLALGRLNTRSRPSATCRSGHGKRPDWLWQPQRHVTLRSPIAIWRKAAQTASHCYYNIITYNKNINICATTYNIFHIHIINYK